MGSWVVLPEPVSPATTTTWCALIAVGDLVAPLADRQVGIGDRRDAGGAGGDQRLRGGELPARSSPGSARRSLQTPAQPGGVADRQAVEARTQGAQLLAG